MEELMNVEVPAKPEVRRPDPSNISLLMSIDKALKHGASLVTLGKFNGISHPGMIKRLKAYRVGVKVTSYLYDLDTGEPLFGFDKEDLRVNGKN